MFFPFIIQCNKCGVRGDASDFVHVHMEDDEYHGNYWCTGYISCPKCTNLQEIKEK